MRRSVGVILRALCSGLGLTLAIACGFAQTPKMGAVRFSVFALRPVPGLSFVPRPGAAAEKVTLNATARSPRYEYRGGQPLRFMDVATGKPVAEASIPAGLQEVLLVLIPVDSATAGRTGLSHQVAVMDDSWARLVAGGLSIVNLSGLSLSGTVGEEKVALQAGLNPPNRMAGPSTEVVLQAPAKGRLVRAYGGSVALRRGERALLLLFPPLRAGSPEVQSRVLIDAPPAGKAAVSPGR